MPLLAEQRGSPPASLLQTLAESIEQRPTTTAHLPSTYAHKTTHKTTHNITHKITHAPTHPHVGTSSSPRRRGHGRNTFTFWSRGQQHVQDRHPHGYGPGSPERRSSSPFVALRRPSSRFLTYVYVYIIHLLLYASHDL
ncbi:hypothetical protein DCS_06106 [Drechmeria coniospora]|uniref:Uncharacterized protein n=1 Tax=Drechmeria coniospora TaxID=98403 RepID=A0A151GAM9_DRECN|nr:hypothetical protein DCS_06106 [Drechmeria coniospora]KYK54149.1 hypothetical protein DCS_06106 [Drechmeria coniospora]